MPRCTTARPDAIQAVKEVMGEIGGAIIAITLVMVSCVPPSRSRTGPVGVFYRQFSITHGRVPS